MTQAQIFSLEFSKIFKNIFYTEHLRATTFWQMFLKNHGRCFWKIMEISMEKYILEVEKNPSEYIIWKEILFQKVFISVTFSTFFSQQIFRNTSGKLPTSCS